MKKAKLCLFIMLFIFVLCGSTAYATEEKQTPKLINSINNTEVSRINAILDNIDEFTLEVMIEIEKYSEIHIQKHNDNYVQLTITNKIPEKINYYNDGTTEDFYTKNTYFGTINSIPYDGDKTISPSDIFVKVRIRADFSVYEVGPAKIEHYRLISGSGGLLNCWENGYRNLVVTPAVSGGYENPDGSTGRSGSLTYPRSLPQNSKRSNDYTVYRQQKHFESMLGGIISHIHYNFGQ